MALHFSRWVLVVLSGLGVQALLHAQTGGSAARVPNATANDEASLTARALPPRVNRHALIIGISRYESADRSPLPGARIDKESATQMAQSMQVPRENIQYLQDEQATGNNIRRTIKELTDKVQEGDRVFIHFSGHGTRYKDRDTGNCVEALLGYDSGWESMITNREMAGLLNPITNKTDKLFVMYDACHSGGVVQVAASVRTRGFKAGGEDGVLRPKFATTSDECGRPVNVKVTRNLLVEAVDKGALPQDIVHLSASRDNEMSFDDEFKGGLATQFMRDCMLRDAKDLDNSGAISMDEIRQCAQEKMDRRMANSTNYTSPHLVLTGNAAFVPAWFSQPLAGGSTAQATQTLAMPPVLPPVPIISPTVAPPVPVVAAPVANAKPPPASATPVAGAVVPVADMPVQTPTAPVSTLALPAPPASVASPAAAPSPGENALRQVFDQRDAKRRVLVSLGKDKLKIGQDALDFSVQSDRAGYVYVALAGSDNKSVYMLFPNDLDQNNKIDMGGRLSLPRSNWRVKAGGPAGTDSLLVLVTDAPRDLKALAGNKAGPFTLSLNDAQGRARLGALMTSSQWVATPGCANAAVRQKNPACSDAFGAAMVTIEEVK